MLKAIDKLRPLVNGKNWSPTVDGVWWHGEHIKITSFMRIGHFLSGRIAYKFGQL